MNYNYDETIITDSYSECSCKKKLDIDLDLYKLIGFKNMISYIFSVNKIWNYTISNKNQYSRLIIEDFSKIKLYKDINLINNNIIDFSLHICFDCKLFNSLTIETFFSNKTQYIQDGDEINQINNYYFSVINKIYEMIIDANIVENYFFECFQIKTGDLFGYYCFDKIEMDCGNKITSYSVPRVIKTKIKYHQIIINEMKNLIPENTTLIVDRKIILTLIQTFSRCYFKNKITNGKFFGEQYNSVYEFNKENPGKMINLNRDKILNEFYEGIPNDTDFYINKFYKLDYEKQNIFLSCCEMYLEGIKEYTSKSLSIFVFALESLANFEFKSKKMSKKQRIYNLILNLYDYEVYSQEFINYIYNLRSIYSHQSISSNQLKQSIFEFYEIDKKLILRLEALTYSVLMKWLERE